MSIKGILILLVVIAAVFLGANYAKVEIQTNIRLKEFADILIPEELGDYKYRKVWATDRTDASLLYVYDSGEKFMVQYFREADGSSDPTSLKEFGDWQYLDHTKIEGLTFPPYF